MQVNVAGRVKNTKLCASKALLPLFEAIVNSIHAIRHSGRTDGKIDIYVNREILPYSEDVHGNFLSDIVGFTIVDNGIGFTEQHFESFNELDSQMKVDIGGKGIGRIYWLIAFVEAQVESHFYVEDVLFKRVFNFKCTPKGVEDHSEPIESNEADRKTIVKLVNFKERYRNNAPKSAEAISRRIVEHCLAMFAHGGLPTIWVYDTVQSAAIDLRRLFEDEYQSSVSDRTFKIGDIDFLIKDVLVKHAIPDMTHKIYFCAHDRAVEDVELCGKIPPLSNVIVHDDGSKSIYCGYISSNILDARVDSDRSGFDFNRKGQFEYDEDGLFWDDIENVSVEMASDYLCPQIEKMKKATLERAAEFIEKEPKYRTLLSHKRDRISNMPSNMTEAQMDIEFHKLLNDWRLEIRQNAKQELAVEDADTDYDQHREKYDKIISELQEVAKADLAEYVVHRATVISFFEKLLGSIETGKFEKEESLHQLIFPLRKTSSDIDYDDHNLWLLDERLSYHHYLASDMRFDMQEGSPVEIDSKDRPDILIYNKHFAFIPGDEPPASVVIVEFKRPERNDYDDGKTPIGQVLRYVDEIRSGKVKRADGSTIEAIPDTVPFYCYIVATLTNKLVRDALERGFVPMPDRQGYFSYNPNYKSYIEICSYRKVASDAKKRNKSFFERLQIPLR